MLPFNTMPGALDMALGAQLGIPTGMPPTLDIGAVGAPSAPLMPPPTVGPEPLARMHGTAPVRTRGPLGRAGPDVAPGPASSGQPRLGDMMASMAKQRRARDPLTARTRTPRTSGTASTVGGSRAGGAGTVR